MKLDEEGKYYLTSVKDDDIEVILSIGRKTTEGRYEEKTAVLLKSSYKLIENNGRLDDDAIEGFKLAVTTPIVRECLRTGVYRFYLSVWDKDFSGEVNDKFVEGGSTPYSVEGYKSKLKASKEEFYVSQRRYYVNDESEDFTIDYLRVFDSSFRMVCVANSFEELRSKKALFDSKEKSGKVG